MGFVCPHRRSQCLELDGETVACKMAIDTSLKDSLPLKRHPFAQHLFILRFNNTSHATECRLQYGTLGLFLGLG